MQDLTTTTRDNKDTLNRVTGLSSQPASYSYQRGPTGNLTQATESNGRTVNWSYDGIYRLTNEIISLDPSHNNGQRQLQRRRRAVERSLRPERQRDGRGGEDVRLRLTESSGLNDRRWNGNRVAKKANGVVTR
jgi:hypothetical protein